MNKMRIDEYLIEVNFYDDIKEAQSNIMQKNVLVNDEPVLKPGMIYNFDEKINIRIKNNNKKYASRGGLKLEEAIKKFNCDFKEKKILDVGSSTGGFTDCSLKHGAKHVWALDVGTNQLSYELRVDERVSIYEKTNFRTISSDFFEEKFDYIVMDVSFISITLLLENVANFLKEDGDFICLIKPQYECEYEIVNKYNGIIDDQEEHLKVINKINEECNKYNLYINEIVKSPITGNKGNQEYLALINRSNNKLI